MFKIRATAVFYEAFLCYNVHRYTIKIRRFTYQLDWRVFCSFVQFAVKCVTGDGVSLYEPGLGR